MSDLLLVGLGVVATALGVMMLGYRKRAFMWQQRSQHWFSVAMGEKPMIDDVAAVKLRDDLFPRPMGATPRSLSTVEDVATLRAWRARRALTSRDHVTRHSVDCFSDSEAAAAILQLCVGEEEVE